MSPFWLALSQLVWQRVSCQFKASLMSYVHHVLHSERQKISGDTFNVPQGLFKRWIMFISVLWWHGVQRTFCCHKSRLCDWLMPSRSRWNIGHRPLKIISILLCLVLSTSSSSSCIWNLLSTILSPSLFTRCSVVFLFLCSLVVTTESLVWQCCHRFLSAYVQASFIFFFLAGPPRLYVFLFMPAVKCISIYGTQRTN